MLGASSANLFVANEWKPQPQAIEDQLCLRWFAVNGDMPTPALPNSLEPCMALLQEHVALRAVAGANGSN